MKDIVDKKVSVIIPVYNRAHSIKKSIFSVLNQTYPNIELIIIDDGSTDNTREVIESVKDKRIRYVYQKNSGACAARNAGINLATGKYIAFQDSDDIWHADKLQKQIMIFENNEVDIVFSKLNVINQDEQIINIIPEGIKEGLLEKYTSVYGIGTQALIGKSEIFKNHKFDTEMPRYQDLELLMRMMENNCKLYCIDEGMVDYYIGGDSISANPNKAFEAIKLIEKKHPYMKKQFLTMMNNFSHMLESAALDSYNNRDNKYIEMLQKANLYKPSILNKILLLLGHLRMFWLVKYGRRIQRLLFVNERKYRK